MIKLEKSCSFSRFFNSRALANPLEYHFKHSCSSPPRMALFPISMYKFKSVEGNLTAEKSVPFIVSFFTLQMSAMNVDEPIMEFL